MSDLLDSWVIVYTPGGKYYVTPDHWSELSTAYHGWMERSHNRVLALVTRDGADVLLAASVITDLCRSTPETRQRNREIEAAEKAESGFTE